MTKFRFWLLAVSITGNLVWLIYFAVGKSGPSRESLIAMEHSPRIRPVVNKDMGRESLLAKKMPGEADAVRIKLPYDIVSQIRLRDLIDLSGKVSDDLARYFSMTVEERQMVDDSIEKFRTELVQHQVSIARIERTTDGKEWIALPDSSEVVENLKTELKMDLSTVLGNVRGDACMQLIEKYSIFQTEPGEVRMRRFEKNGVILSETQTVFQGNIISSETEIGVINLERKYGDIFKLLDK